MTAETAEPEDDLEVILPSPTDLRVAGIECQLRRLKAREFFQLMAVLTNGMGPALSQMKLSTDDQEEFAGAMIGAFMVALPNAVDDFILLCDMIVIPKYDEDQGKLKEAMRNPELDDLMHIVDCVIYNEQDDLYQLLGKARAYLGRWKNTVQNGSQDRSPELST